MVPVSKEPLVLPPVVPSIKTIIETSISQVEKLEIHSLGNNLRRLECPKDSLSLRRAHPTQLPLNLQLLRDPGTGARKKTVLVENSILQETSKTSYSLTRAPGPRHESVKGNSTNLPFMPGGLEDKDEKCRIARRSTESPAWVDNEEEEAILFAELFDNDRLVDLPNKKGIEFKDGNKGSGPNNHNASAKEAGLPMDYKFDFWQGQDKSDVKADYRAANKEMRKERSLNHLLKELKDAPEIPLPMEDDIESKPPVLAISKAPTVTTFQTKMQWSEAVDISKPMDDFEERVPDMAFKYKFELDTFQKQAIVRLEEHENVFVAAHTSAGKTVVAEYAIALSARHMTRTIYTSPIKALSNQKFRDFKKDFESVGLVTGDVQINQNASCLIMTTEILRSMLYNGSDVIRDLEWVVFDEIHYLNNEERGHVWEEVLIMLPQHVSIIMLSATVPNALQFANWVGGIKKKKIHVISTSKRPVPLEHHLYTGSGGKSRKEQFLVLGAEGRFLKSGYDSAKEALTERMSKFAKEFGPKPNRQNNKLTMAAEKNTYIGLVNHLKESEKLPVVIFTFSRNRCDNYAEMLSSVDLCTGAEKGKIHGFFQQSISKLKGTDRDLPQVVAFQRMLKNGIGVHHSGILPILKEVVEMLFQQGLVKLLFATETFAMGVNMPARTVVFDSIRKHDGTQFRSLNPAEYIQMAGRAGRRGLDTTGTVIILCKQAVPDLNDINYMMLGSAAKLESQFRLTYSMILNLLRVESITVEDVMKRSFLEAGKFVKVDEVKEKRAAINEKLIALDNHQRNPYLIHYYTEMKQYFGLQYFLMDKIVVMPKVMENMKPGRIVIVEDLPRFSVRFGILLNSRAVKEAAGLEKRFKVLILTSPSDKERPGLELSESEVKLMDNTTVNEVNRLYHLMLYYSHKDLIDFEPQLNAQGFPPHLIIEVRSHHILELCDESTRVDIDAITSDINRREMARFRDTKPVPNLLKTVEYLFDLHSDLNLGRRRVKLMNMFLMTPFKDPGLIESVQAFTGMKHKLKHLDLFDGSNACTVEEFTDAFRYQRLVDEMSNLDFALSPKSLQLHEEYQQRIRVLKTLGYIDEDNLVLLKGRVACEMGNQHELMMTELLLNNTLSDCEPAEIAALLSCMVFEANRIEEPELPQEAAHLAKKVKEVKDLARHIGTIQRQHDLKEPVEQFVEQFKFGLVEVVYEWAKGKPFFEIMKLTEVQEGLIVRTIQRLDEMIRDVKDASRIIGDPSLKMKMEDASQCIKRDIVFAASLYTQ